MVHLRLLNRLYQGSGSNPPALIIFYYLLSKMAVFDYSYYINLRNINPDRAEEYRLEAFPLSEPVEVTGSIDVPQDVVIDPIDPVIEDITDPVANNDIDNSVQEIVIDPVIDQSNKNEGDVDLTLKDIKNILKEKWVKNTQFLTEEQAVAKMKELGL